MINSINIRPSVGMLYNMRYMNYEQSFALAEFVDNAIQSFIDNEVKIKSINGEDTKLKVNIFFRNGSLFIEDNAGGINTENYPRAFSAGARPPETDGLSEFGMGMKAAACWYANNWEVHTTALDEPIERRVGCDMTEIMRNNRENLEVIPFEIDSKEHFTRIILTNLHQRPYGKGYTKIQDYLSSIYRLFLKTGQLHLYCFNKLLSFPETTKILNAPSYNNLQGASEEWKILIDLKLKTGMQVSGFAALRDRGTARGAGFSLFRRKRLIMENYLPEEIFGQPNSAVSQRLFGELHIENVGVSFAKDRFNWNENEEEIFVDELEKKLERLIDQAKNLRYRDIRPKPDDDNSDDSADPAGPESETTQSIEPESETTQPVEPESETTQPVEPESETTQSVEPNPVPSEPHASVLERIVKIKFQGEELEINLNTPLIYFLKLPEGNVIKIGKTSSVTLLAGRKSSAQTYFVDDVNFLGLIPFSAGDDLDVEEQKLLDRFGRANTTRDGCELIYDTPEIRKFIDTNCRHHAPYIRAARRS